MEVIGHGGKSETSSEFDLGTQLSLDMDEFLGSFADRSFGIRCLAQKSDVNEKTIRRLLTKSNRPTYSTLLRLYLTLKGVRSFDELLPLCPKVVAKELKRKKASTTDQRLPLDSQFNFLKAIEEQPVVGEIYVLAATSPIHRNDIVNKYGQFGMEIVGFLEVHGLIQQIKKNLYTTTPNGPIFDGKVIKSIGSHFLKQFSRATNGAVKGENTLGFYACSLNEGAYKEWLRIDEEAFYKKVQLGKELTNQGDKKVFTLVATDTIGVGQGVE